MLGLALWLLSLQGRIGSGKMGPVLKICTCQTANVQCSKHAPELHVMQQSAFKQSLAWRLSALPDQFLQARLWCNAGLTTSCHLSVTATWFSKTCVSACELGELLQGSMTLFVMYAAGHSVVCDGHAVPKLCHRCYNKQQGATCWEWGSFGLSVLQQRHQRNAKFNQHMLVTYEHVYLLCCCSASCK